ncbi:MAG: helix-turn-helix transcriptional regulator [Prosthecobacter sp.]|uniref:helix-turn-helix transcriptional regulator n=1 Tax=Prosthecobacter sp. TaxID=1965333 RepID=UPI0038FD4C71
MLPSALASLVTFHRKRAKLSQAELARHAGVSRFVVQDIEAGRDRTTWRNLLAVLAVLNLKLEPKGPLVAEWQQTQIVEEPKP